MYFPPWPYEANGPSKREICWEDQLRSSQVNTLFSAYIFTASELFLGHVNISFKTHLRIQTMEQKNATFYVLLQVVCRNCFPIGQNSSISQLKAFANSQNKPNHTKRRGIKNCARKWYLFFCSIWFVVTWAL